MALTKQQLQEVTTETATLLNRDELFQLMDHLEPGNKWDWPADQIPWKKEEVLMFARKKLETR